MKKLKRISALLLAVIMTIAMGLPALAASSADFGDTFGGKIVIHKYDTSDYENYVPGTGNGTKLDSTDKIGEDGAGADVTVDDLSELPNIPFLVESVVIMTQAELDAVTGGGTTVDPTNPAHYKATTTITADTYTTDSSGEIILTGLPQGTYRITEQTNSTSSTVADPFLISLPMTDPTDTTGNTTMKEVHVYPKNKTYNGPDVDKIAGTVTINDTYSGKIIPWKITAEVPGTISGAAEKESYVLTDTYGEYLSYVTGSVKVYYMNGSAEELLAEGVDYTIDTSGTRTVKITLTQTGRKKLADAINATPSTISGTSSYDYALYFEYKTLITISDTEWESLIADAEKEGITNDVVLDFTNDSGTSYKSDDDDKPVLYRLKIHKYDGANTGTSLAGAKFKIYTALLGSGDVDTSTVLKDENGNEVEVTTDTNGVAYINGLPAGTYYLVETAAPTGYSLNSTPIKVEIDPTSSTTLVDYGTVTSEVPNYNDFTLPKTGGMGTMLFTIGGVILLAAAGVVFFISRRKKAE
ncbi:MAG: SpaH/EbpB family LPXTG-anchored major pilin [Lachnospiraceae bacterium]